MAHDELLHIQDLSKTFSGVVALDKVQLTVAKGEVHCLLGENGAGKSTLMKCIIGIHQPTGGAIYFDGQKVEHNSVIKSLERGISMIHQELTPVFERSIMENIFLGREPKNKLGLVDHKKMADMTREVLSHIELDEDPHLPIKHCTVAKMQMIEIAKAVSYNAKLIIMDEPTSSLTGKEIRQLFKIIRRLKAEGRSIIFISHKLDEIKAICDQITIYRDGQFIAQRPVSDTTPEEMISLMVGRATRLHERTPTPVGEVVLKVSHLSDGKHFRDVSFELKQGEVLGFAGLVGAGRSEVMETLFGYRPQKQGEIHLNGQPITNATTHQAIANGFAFLTEDRKKTGIIPMLGVGANIVIGNLKNYRNVLGLLNAKRMHQDMIGGIAKLKVKTASPTTRIMNLSGGNQQKALIAKWLALEPDILILDEPTRGIDVGSKSEIHKNIAQLAASGKSILLVSSELPEVLGLSHRVVVMHEGRITGILNNDGLTGEEVIAYATGEKHV